MSHLRGSTLAFLGLLIGVVPSILIYFTQLSLIQDLVYTTYVGIINSFQLYELAWIMATIDFLLDLSNPFSFLLWIGLTVIVTLLIRNMNAAVPLVSISVLLPGGTWLLFAFKYSTFLGLDLLFIPTFFFWRIFLPLLMNLGLATLLSIPFWIRSRERPSGIEAPKTLCFICSECKTEYRSKPLICVECGEEGTIKEK